MMWTWETIMKGILVMDATLLAVVIAWTLIIVTYKILKEKK